MYWITGLLGILLIIAPFVLGFSADTMALWSCVVLGAIALIVSIIKAAVHSLSNWEYWVTGIMGVLAIIAPFVLAFSTVSAALWSSVILGILLLVLSAYELFAAAPRQVAG